MATIPQITIQLVHIQGPLKGEIQEFSDNEIRIGRHPDCQVMFPKDEVTLSRQHARIIREGNRFKLIDESTNGSYVNGKRVAEAYLKDGDVITFSEAGPKVSFLTSTQTVSNAEHTTPAPQPASPPPKPSASTKPLAPTEPSAPKAPSTSRIHGVTASPFQRQQTPEPKSTPAAAVPAPPAPVVSAAAVTARVPLAIQFGVALKSFQTLPITIGRGGGSDFIIDQPSLENQQAQIFFTQEQYWIKDLSGSGAIRIDGIPIQGQSPLTPDCHVTLSAHGPVFKFLAGGRLVELDDQPAPKQGTPPEPEKEKQSNEPGGTEKKAGGLFKKFFT